MRKLYTIIEKEKTLREFIIKLFTINGYLDRCNVTFLDKEMTKLECKVARRSFEDLLSIVNTVYENISENELAKTLFDLNKNPEETTKRRLCIYYCNDITKWVFRFYDKKYLDNTLMYDSNQTFIQNQKGSGKYSFKDIYKIANGEK